MRPGPFLFLFAALPRRKNWQEKFLKRVWPGKVTAVLKTIGGRDTVGLRIPNYPLLLAVLKKSKMVLTGTSANISGQPASGKINEVLEQFRNRQDQPDAAIDAGNLEPSKSSTIIDLTRPVMRILRK